MDSTFWFLIVLIIAAVHAKIRKNHRIMSINFQNTLGAQTVMIQKMIIMIAKENINQNGRDCLVSVFHI